MKIIAVIDCDSCHTLEKYELQEGENVVPSCRCDSYFGDSGGKVEIKINNKD